MINHKVIVTSLLVIVGWTAIPNNEALAQGVSGTLEEVIVTARRREENLQRVTLAITALTAADLEIRSIENTEDLNVLLPNVDIRGSVSCRVTEPSTTTRQ